MNRLLIVVAAGLVGSGCISTSSDPQPGDVNIYWEFARHAPAATGGIIYYDAKDPVFDAAHPNRSCDESGVDVVYVTDPAGVRQQVPCVFGNVQGIQFPWVPGGTFRSRIEAYRGSKLVYDSSFDVHVDHGADVLISVEGVSAALDLFGDLGSGSADHPTFYPDCGSAGTPNIGYEIADVFGDTVDSGVVGCSNPLPAIVFSDNLDLDDYYVRMRGLALSGGAVTFDSCWVPLDHFSAQTGSGGVTVNLLTNPVPTCAAPSLKASVRSHAPSDRLASPTP